MIIFLTSGLWHGASWHFVIWGALNGFFQIIGDSTKKYRQKILQLLEVNTRCFSYRLLQMVLTFILVDFTWIFFRADGFKVALQIIQKMFSTFNPWILFDGTLFTLGMDRKDFIVALIAIAILWIVDYFHTKGSVRQWISQQNLIFRWGLYYFVIFSILIFGIYGPGYDAAAFIYFQF